MRASIMLLGPLLARFGHARLPLPGGCALGDRPVDMHERGLRAMGADIQTEHGVMVASLPQGRFRGADFRFPIPSVTGTEHLMMAACLARGTTRLQNAALEPEVVALAQMLRTMGADIEGEGTDCVVVRGVERLHGAMCPVPPDRIEAGTWLAAAAATRGRIEVLGEGLQIGAQVERALRGMGADLQLREGPRSWTPGTASCAGWSCRRRRTRLSPPTCSRSSWRWRPWAAASATSRIRCSTSASATPPSCAAWAPMCGCARAGPKSRAWSASAAPMWWPATCAPPPAW